MEINPGIEFEPLTMDDNTEVKIPVPVGDVTRSCDSDDNYDCLSPLINQQEEDVNTAFFREYNRLTDMFRGLPSVTFVSTVLKEYSSSETDLENTRSQLFEALKSNEDFPYDQDSELKKRVFRGKGDPVSVKLANDIHSLISVMDGENYTIIKEMISDSKKRSCSQSTFTQQPKPINNCQCNIELELLKGTVSALQADVLLIKQTNCANDKLRTDQIRFVTETVQCIRQDITNCQKSINECVSKSISTIDRTQSLNALLETSLGSAVGRIDALEEFVKSPGVVKIAQCSTHGSPLQINKVQTGFSNLGLFDDDSTATSEEQTVSYSKGNQTENSSKVCISQMEIFLRPTGANQTHDMSNQEQTNNIKQCQRNTRDTNHVYVIDDDSPECSPQPRILEKNHVTSDSWDFIPRTQGIYSRNRNFKPCTYPNMSAIPVRITTRTERDERQYDAFDWHKTAPTKRFFVSGFKKSVTIKKLTNFVTNRGPSVTMIRKFPMRKSRNKVVVRLNVEANENADLVLDTGFWPRGITCMPWLSRAELRQRDRRDNDAHTSNDNQQYDSYSPKAMPANRSSIEEWSPFDDFNMFHALTPDID